MTRIEELEKEKQQPNMPKGKYTLGAKCECGHVFKYHDKLGQCRKLPCNCKMFRYTKFSLPKKNYKQGLKEGISQEQKRVEKLIDKRIKEHKDCNKIDTYEEQHMEHSVILSELKYIKSELKKQIKK